MGATDRRGTQHGARGRYALDDPVVRLRGIGPRWAEELASLGVGTVGDLLLHLPLRWIDRREIAPLSAARPDRPLTAVGTVREVRTLRTRRRGLDLMQLLVDDGTAAIRVVFFGRNYLAEYIRRGTRLLVQGTPRLGSHGLELTGPEFEILREGEDPAALTGWIPVYEKLGPLSSRRLRTVIGEALDGLGPVDDPIPAALRARHGLPALDEALREVHRPPPDTPAELLAERRLPGLRRLAYDELFWLELALALARRQRLALGGAPRLPLTGEIRARIAELLPFTLTGAQTRVFGEIADDLASGRPMSRLLLGDVGSGKTVVAAMAMLVAVEHGWQAALMAPTEILARQHGRTLARLMGRVGRRVELLTAALRQTEARAVRARLASGAASLVVGTHALISESVAFRKLGLVVIDEQHRFGVAQRASLADKGTRPHLLVMSATPIPRTLAMVLYGDLDVSVIDEKPPGRLPIRTVVRREDERERVFAGLERALAEGRRVYVVRPAVEEGARGLKAAEQGLAEYRARFPEARVALVHGRMKPDERRANLDAFARGEVDILVATTVIEVGIDVPEASVIVVEDADRFGLAQLHQLRGRVGRGDRRSYCVLIASQDADEHAMNRLRVLEQTDDGFRVAEKDLELRGPGELTGTAQHGLPSLRVADLVRHKDLLLAARDDAFALVEREGGTLPEALWREVWRRHGERLKLARIG
ncbi:MAG: ATP-dependent DNA helicase RecG [Acidobacteriota bacterium]